MEVTLDDDGSDVTALRLDIVFDNDLIDWDHDDTEVLKGSYLTEATEGDSTAGADYSYQVVHYSDVGYIDALQDSDGEKSEENARYDWLRITMVSHNGEEFTFGDGEGEQTQLLKMYFKIEDVVDDFKYRSAARSKIRCAARLHPLMDTSATATASARTASRGTRSSSRTAK